MGTQGVQNKFVSISSDNTLIRLFGLYLCSFFHLLHIPFRKCNCKILWYLYSWQSRGTRFQMNIRQCLKQNENNKANLRTAFSYRSKQNNIATTRRSTYAKKSRDKWARKACKTKLSALVAILGSLCKDVNDGYENVTLKYDYNNLVIIPSRSAWKVRINIPQTKLV